jgi:hypothetical protein
VKLEHDVRQYLALGLRRTGWLWPALFKRTSGDRCSGPDSGRHCDELGGVYGCVLLRVSETHTGSVLQGGMRLFAGNCGSRVILAAKMPLRFVYKLLAASRIVKTGQWM